MPQHCANVIKSKGGAYKVLTLVIMSNTSVLAFFSRGCHYRTHFYVENVIILEKN